jgi:SAM-dependent methyltransferase
MDAAEFEARYRHDADPWRYRTSHYEHAKYEATLAACGPGPFDSALELGGSIGVFSARLAPRCRRLTTIDFAPSAVARARVELREHPHADVLLGTIPASIPAGPFDLALASEVLYYLSPDGLTAAIARLRDELAPGGRLVAVHWRAPGPERPLDAPSVHAALAGEPWLTRTTSAPTDRYLLDVFTGP